MRSILLLKQLLTAITVPAVPATSTFAHAETIIPHHQLLKRFGIPTRPKEETTERTPFLTYSLFDGRSALRDLPVSTKSSAFQASFQSSSSGEQQQNPSHDVLPKASIAILLLLAGYGDAAHDVILGTTFDNLEQAEYAATHRGQTNWTQEHPLEDIDDLVHSIIHRQEGSDVGEGGYTGYENAEYWACGGPKKCESVLTAVASSNDDYYRHVDSKLCRFAKERAPKCVEEGVIAKSATVYDDVIAGGGKYRSVTVPKGSWDAIRMIRLFREQDTKKNDKGDLNLIRAELDTLQQKELELLLQYDLDRNKRQLDGIIMRDEVDIEEATT